VIDRPRYAAIVAISVLSKYRRSAGSTAEMPPLIYCPGRNSAAKAKEVRFASKDIRTEAVNLSWMQP
jgi:hypothetical protein